ncbi:Chromatin modification-related protein EAF3 [Hypsizygus marmoreus]|uniref:Chromatin modification-related protein EAF3 n=1 Tax=Hypsizygus marmoreus TaxID=39966 RepID=A0A369JLY1_HYPMA|nr:Chromatin modification-related protein EAF3 [Hypsizygus marmoreus]
MSASATPAITFTTNERALCYHGPLIYEAKVLKVQTFDEASTVTGHVGPHYFVHYKGWKQTWDEWVPSSRILKINETNLELQKTLQRSNAPATGGASSSRSHQKGGVNKDGGAGSTRAGTRKDGTRGTKRGREEDESSKKPDLKLNLPEVLKVLLVDDWEAVTKNNQLVPLPRTPTVVELLDEFAAYVVKTKPAHLKEPDLLIPSIISGLVAYFDRSLGANLLYRFERPQFAEVRKKYKTGQQVIIGQEKEVSAVYGAEHLLRMIVSLPGMISSSSLDPESVNLVRDYVNKLLEWMVKECDRIFVKEYESTSLQYQNISRS